MKKKTTYLSGLTPLMQPLQKVTAPLLCGKNALWAQLRLHWEDIVGSTWASHTNPERLIFPTERKPRGILHVAVWGESRLALAYEAAYVCEKINQYFGFGAVHEVKWRTTSPPPTPIVQNSSYVSQHRSLEPSEEKWIEDQTAVLPNLLQNACHAFGESLLKASERRVL